MLHLLNSFSEKYQASIEGLSNEVKVNELNGGARIRFILHETYSKHLERIDPLEGLTDADIKTAISNTAVKILIDLFNIYFVFSSYRVLMVLYFLKKLLSY